MPTANAISNRNRPIGLIAGWGSLPVQVAESLRRAGHPVFCVAIAGHASTQLDSICDDVLWSGVGRIGGHLRYFRRHDAKHVTMAGKLFKADLLFSGSLWLKHLPDLTCIPVSYTHLTLPTTPYV